LRAQRFTGEAVMLHFAQGPRALLVKAKKQKRKAEK
jgi:hypothetical protein